MPAIEVDTGESLLHRDDNSMCNAKRALSMLMASDEGL